MPESTSGSAAGVVTKRIDRGDGASEVSFYAIGPKRPTYGEALADLQRFDAGAEPARPWTYCADRMPATRAHGERFEVAVLNLGSREVTREIWPWPGRNEGAGLVAFAWRPLDGETPPLRPADRSYLLTQGVPAEWLGTPEEG